MFPRELTDQARWMIRPAGKQPVSAHETKPTEYEPPPGVDDPNSSYWRWRWTVPAVWATFDKARSYADRFPDVEGLSFVLHPAGRVEPGRRLIALDFDSAVSETGEVDAAVVQTLETLGTWTEFSRSGRGLHAFLLVDDCPAFVNNLKKSIGNCHVDILCSAQVAVTGQALDETTPVKRISFDELKALPFFSFAEAKGQSTQPDWWAEDPLDDVLPEHGFLVSHMTMEEAIEGHGGSQVLFAAACTLANHGVTGRAAEALLRLVPASPPFEPEDIQRTIECAYARVMADGEFDSEGAVNEFDVIPEAPQSDKPKSSLYGFDPVPIGDLVRADLKIEYLVDRAFIGEGALIVGGKEKCFKTNLCMDLAISLITGGEFLGEFSVLERREVSFFTAEIGKAAAQQLALRVMRSKGLDPMSVDGLDVIDTVPNLSLDPRTRKPIDKRGAVGLKAYLRDRRPGVAIFDPLYWALSGASVGDMYEMGATLRWITEACNDYGIWPIFCHHGRKGSKEEQYQPMVLSDLYGAGVQQFARQWMLVSHAEDFRDGKANLFVRIGSSGAGDRGLWRLTVDEGQSDVIVDKRWQINIVREGSETGLSDQSVLEAIKALDNGKGVALADIKFMLDAPSEAAVDQTMRRLISMGLVQMIPGKRFTKKAEDLDFG